MSRKKDLSSIWHQLVSWMKSKRKPPNSVRYSKPVDLFYGHESTARICARFVMDRFKCPEYPPGVTLLSESLKLPQYIAYITYRTRLPHSITIAALVILQRLKARFPPDAEGSSGHILFLTAYMVAAKGLTDDAYTNKAWHSIAQDIFQLEALNSMERDLCRLVDWDLNVSRNIMDNFSAAVSRDFGEDKVRYPQYNDRSLFSSRAGAEYVTESTTAAVSEPSTAGDALSYIDEWVPNECDAVDIVDHTPPPTESLQGKALPDPPFE